MPRTASQSLTTPCRAICSGRLSRPHRLRPAANRRPPATTSATTNSAPMPPPGRTRQATASEASSNPQLQAIPNPAATNRPRPTTASWTRCSSHRCCATTWSSKRPIPNGCCSTAWATSSNASSKTRSNSPGCWNSPSPAKRAARRSDRCRWRHPPPRR